VKTCHQVGLVSRHVALTVALEPGTPGPGPAVGLSEIPVLCLDTGACQTALVYTVLSILQADTLAGYATCVLTPGPCGHDRRRDEDQCDDRTNQDFADHFFRLLFIAGTGSQGAA